MWTIFTNTLKTKQVNTLRRNNDFAYLLFHLFLLQKFFFLYSKRRRRKHERGNGKNNEIIYGQEITLLRTHTQSYKSIEFIVTRLFVIINYYVNTFFYLRSLALILIETNKIGSACFSVLVLKLNKLNFISM